MRVLHVADAIDPSLGGGTFERTFQLALDLHRAGVSSTILCTDMGLEKKRRAELKDVELVAVPVLLMRFLIPIISLSRIRELVARADIVKSSGGRVELQTANLLFVLAMFLSSIHFSVITRYLWNGIFIFHLAYEMYIPNAKPDPLRLTVS